MPVGSGPTNPDLVLDAIRKGATWERSKVHPDYCVLRKTTGEIVYLTCGLGVWELSAKISRVFSRSTFTALHAAAVSGPSEHGYVMLGGWSHALVAREVDGVAVAELVAEELSSAAGVW